MRLCGSTSNNIPPVTVLVTGTFQRVEVNGGVTQSGHGSLSLAVLSVGQTGGGGGGGPADQEVGQGHHVQSQGRGHHPNAAPQRSLLDFHHQRKEKYEENLRDLVARVQIGRLLGFDAKFFLYS